MLSKDLIGFLNNEEFLNIATCSVDNMPNVAPKFLLKIENDSIYLVDYVINTTWRNIKINPRVSMSIVNVNTLKGYQINGLAEIIDKGLGHRELLEEFKQKQINLSTKRLIEALHKEKRGDTYEAGFSEKIAIFRIKVDEVVDIEIDGKLKRTRY